MGLDKVRFVDRREEDRQEKERIRGLVSLVREVVGEEYHVSECGSRVDIGKIEGDSVPTYIRIYLSARTGSFCKDEYKGLAEKVLVALQKEEGKGYELEQKERI